MKCDICGRRIKTEEGECLFLPRGENKSWCYDCKQKAEQDGTASWLSQNRNKNNPNNPVQSPNGFPWLKIFLIIGLVALVGFLIYLFFSGKDKKLRCRYCGRPKFSCDCPYFLK